MKKRSIFLPLLAVLFAIAGAFATGSMKDSSLTPILVTDSQAVCNEIGTCDGSGELCKTENQDPVYDIESEACSVRPNGTFTPNF